MPTIWHDSGTSFAKEHPNATEALAREAGIPLPRSARLKVATRTSFIDRPSRELIPDTVLYAGTEQDPAYALIVEHQQAPSEDKLRQWPRYASAVWLHFRCPVGVLVICPDEQVADWYDKPIETTLDGYTLRVIMLRARHVPRLDTAEEVTAKPAIGVASVAYHGASDLVLDAFARGVLALEDSAARKYYEEGIRMSPAVVRTALEALMETRYQEPFSRLGLGYFREGEAQGRQEGRQEGLSEGIQAGRALERIVSRRETLRTVIELRGLTLSASQEKSIEDCDDQAVLERWITRSKTATDPYEIFR
jgi:hypothetical protein